MKSSSSKYHYLLWLTHSLFSFYRKLSIFENQENNKEDIVNLKNQEIEQREKDIEQLRRQMKQVEIDKEDEVAKINQ